MSFISYEFLLFFLIIFSLYWIAPKQSLQNLVLFISSFVFYSWLVPWHAGFLFVSIVIDYLLGLGMARWKSRSALLMWLGIAINIGLLISIKYYFIFDETLASWVSKIGVSNDILLSMIILPLGVSFYTLKKISYLIEVHRGGQQPEHDFIAFAAYVSFFPQVFSGPIDRPQKLLHQLKSPRIWVSSHFYDAWQLLLMGFFKKIVVANTVKVFVDQIFLMKEPSIVFLMVGGLGFTLQIFADFSSYTDLSRGFAFLLGLQTTENFNKPYLALTPSEFWNRWHISFSSWLRDYVFFPLRRILLRIKTVPEILNQIIPPLVTMFISGLWHGTGWTFIVWGIYYGLLIIGYQLIGVRGDWKPANTFKRYLAWVAMFVFIVFGWIIFRSPSLSWLWNALISGIYYRSSEELIASLVILTMIIFYASFLLAKHILEQYANRQTNLHSIYYTVIATLTLIYINSSSPDFIYFQF